MRWKRTEARQEVLEIPQFHPHPPGLLHSSSTQSPHPCGDSDATFIMVGRHTGEVDNVVASRRCWATWNPLLQPNSYPSTWAWPAGAAAPSVHTQGFCCPEGRAGTCAEDKRWATFKLREPHRNHPPGSCQMNRPLLLDGPTYPCQATVQSQFTLVPASYL